MADHAPTSRGYGRWSQALILGMLAACSTGSQGGEPPHAADAPAKAVVAPLAKRLAPTSDDEPVAKEEVRRAYEVAYGSVGDLPKSWEGLVRRALTCRILSDAPCVSSTFSEIDKLGGVDALPLSDLQEVRRYHLPLPTLTKRLQRARAWAQTETVKVQAREPHEVVPDASAAPAASAEPATSASSAPITAAPTPRQIPAHLRPLKPVTATPQPPDPSRSWAFYALASIPTIGFAALLLLTIRRRRGLSAERSALKAEREHLDAIRRDNQAEREGIEKRATELEVRERQAAVQALVDQRISEVLRSAAVPPAQESAKASEVQLVPPAKVEPVAAVEPVKAVEPPQVDPSPAAAPATKHAEEPLNARHAAALRLLDTLHEAERSAEPFFEFIGDAGANDTGNPTKREIIRSWHASVQTARNSLLDYFQNTSWPTELPMADRPTTLGQAMQRLMDQAALFTSLLEAQQKKDTALYYWSRLLPAAVMHLYWQSASAKAAEHIQQNPLPRLNYSAAPSPDQPRESEPAPAQVAVPPAPQPAVQPAARPAAQAAKVEPVDSYAQLTRRLAMGGARRGT